MDQRFGIGAKVANLAFFRRIAFFLQSTFFTLIFEGLALPNLFSKSFLLNFFQKLLLNFLEIQ